MKYKPFITKKVIIFDLKKPIYGTFFGLWDKWLKVAKNKNLSLVVNTPFGKCTYKSYREWVKGSKKMKRYYKNPDVPMIFYGRQVGNDIKERDKRKKFEKRIEKSKGDVLINVLEKMKTKQPQLFDRVRNRVLNQ